jgi:hypothetical protein
MNAVKIQLRRQPLAQTAKGIAHQGSTDTARGASAAGLFGRFLHITPEGVYQADFVVENQKATIAEKSADRIVLVKVAKTLKVGKSRIGFGGSFAIPQDFPVPYPVKEMGHDLPFFDRFAVQSSAKFRSNLADMERDRKDRIRHHYRLKD